MITSVKINFKLAIVLLLLLFFFLLQTLFCREKDNPSPDLRYQCSRMSLLLSEDHAWESTLCNEATAAVGVCQYEWQSGIYIQEIDQLQCVNCCVIIHCLEVSCKEDQITSAQ